MADLDAVEDYAARLQTGSPRAGDLVNVPTALLDASWVSSLDLGVDTVLVGTVQGMGYERTGIICIFKDLGLEERRRRNGNMHSHVLQKKRQRKRTNISCEATGNPVTGGHLQLRHFRRMRDTRAHHRRAGRQPGS